MPRNNHLARCGHMTKRRGTITAFGESYRTTLPIVDGGIDYCHHCLSTMAIKCACCQRAIFLNAAVAEFFDSTLMARANDDNRITDAVGVVICRRVSCNWQPVTRNGTWALDREWNQGHFVPSDIGPIPLRQDDTRVA